MYKNALPIIKHSIKEINDEIIVRKYLIILIALNSKQIRLIDINRFI